MVILELIHAAGPTAPAEGLYLLDKKPTASNGPLGDS